MSVFMTPTNKRVGRQMTYQSSRALSLAVFFMLCFADEAVGQIGNPFEQSGQCDMSTLASDISKLDGVCCVNPQTSENKNQCDLDPCDADCVAVLLPLLDNCGPMLNLLYDGTDGKFDGHAQVFSKVYSECLAIPGPTLLQELKVLQANGQCPNTVLDGVATMEVEGSECTDHWQNHLGCEAAITSGFLTCEVDFCDTPPTTTAPCDLAGHCDLSCGLCTVEKGDGHRRRRLIQKRRDLRMRRRPAARS
jgi:hypothetical protein